MKIEKHKNAPLPYLLAALVFLGHCATTLWAYNRLHALAWSHRRIKWVEAVLLLAAAAAPLFASWRIAVVGQTLAMPANWATVDAIGIVYAMFCLAVALTSLPAWLWRQVRRKEATPALVSNHTATRDVASELGKRPVFGRKMEFFAALPANRILRLDIHEKMLRLDRLPVALDGLKIAHLSDIHLTGKFTIEFCDYLVDRINEWRPEVVAITGDIVDKTPCIDWLPKTLGRLQAPGGVFFVLGNHDKRLPPQQIEQVRETLVACGLVDLGGRSMEIELRGEPVFIAGNEAPWFAAPEIASDHAPHPAPHTPFRLLLAHSPDQLPWAKARRFDLMLAGHTHGGQIRFPLIGPIVAPSMFGVKYASGLFYEAPTLMHVSRGVCGVHPVRFNCPPELALLTLTSEVRE